MAAQDDVVTQEATGASTDVDLEEGNHAQTKLIPPEDPDDEEHAPSSPFASVRAPTPRLRLYLMVLADFGLAFTWLTKFAVAT